MAITPNTNIRLLKVPFEIDNKNQLTFANKQAQTNYFLSLNAIEIEHAQYQRKDNIMYFPAHIDSILEYNYIMYQNENYSNKWFYAFITNKTYNNDGLTELTLKTDVFQTWQFDIIYKKSFIEREHVNDDTIGKHTIEENLNVGEVICEEQFVDSSYDINENGFYVIVETTYDPATGKDFQFFTIQNNNFAGSRFYAFKIDIPITTNTVAKLTYFLTKTNVDSKIESIKNIYIVPDASIQASWLEQESFTYDDLTINIQYIKPVQTYSYFNTEITKRTSFSNLNIKNNKCFVYPYNYLYVTNNTGSNNIYRYENFNSNKCIFTNDLSFSIGGDAKLVPLNYKNITKNDDESITLGKYPTCSWASDSFTNWLTQNGVNVTANVLTSAIGITASIASTALSGGATAPVAVGAIATASSSIAQTIGEFHQANLLPSTQTGSNNGNINFASNRDGFYFYQMRAKDEYITIIDNFFSMYGYKINEVKLPNINGRSNWNYVKTIDINLLGEIPQEDLEEIKQIFNNGVTLWHNATTFLDYSQNNNIV